ncbi:MAG: lysyl oxidase family protein [Thermodesulfobacteriota bacterium]
MRLGLALCVAVLATVASGALAQQNGPDLELDVGQMRSSARIVTGIYHPPGRAPQLDATIPVSGTCVLHPDENCVGGPGIRKLLRFDVLVHNRGDEDLVVGSPNERPDLFVYSACHRHYHFRDAALYELLDASGAVVKTGRKQGFCIEDTLPSSDGPAPPKRYDCKFQGVQVGWADWYPSVLDCQWIDVTDLPAGDYVLHVFWNPNRRMPETRIDNNEGSVPITIPAPSDPAPVVDEIRNPSATTTARTGQVLEVEWSAHDDAGVVTQEVWLSTDDGATWQQLVGDVPGERSSFRWLVPARVASPNARLRVVARDASVQRGELTSERFRIVRSRPKRLPTQTAN